MAGESGGAAAPLLTEGVSERRWISRMRCLSRDIEELPRAGGGSARSASRDLAVRAPPSAGPHTHPQRRLTRAFGRRRARSAMPRIAPAHAPGRKPW